MNYEDIIQDLSEFLKVFDSQKDYQRRRTVLKIRTRDSWSNFRRQWGWERVGEIRQAGKGPATIVNVYSSAPNYIKSLEGKTCKNFPVLQNEIRSAAFRHEARKVFRKYLSAEMKQFEEAD